MVEPTNIGTVNTIADLKTVAVPPTSFTTISVNGYHTPGDGGGGVFRWASSSGRPANDGTVIASGSGFWLRIVEESRNYDPRWFGAKGDAVTNDTLAFQRAIDEAMVASVGVEMSCGDYLVGPLKGNGSSWNSQLEADRTGGQSSVLSFRGQGRSPYLCRLIAMPGAYNATLKAVLTFRNVAGVTISGFQIDANNEAEVCGDFAWIGGTSATEIAAPSCHNEFTHLWGQNAKRIGWNMDQAADSKVSAIHYHGGTASVGLSFRLGGGGIWADNVFLSTGKLLVTSQNCGLQNCGFFGGVEITGTAMNKIHLDSCHLYPYTPKRSFFSTVLNSPFKTKANSNHVAVNMIGHGLATGDLVRFTGAVDVAGIPAAQLNSPAGHLVSTVNPFLLPEQQQPNPNQFWITVTSNANADATGGGNAVVAQRHMFATTSNSNVVKVNMVSHGLKKGNLIQFSGAGDVGGITRDKLNGTHSVKTVVNADQFTIEVAASANSATTSGGTVTVLANPFTTQNNPPNNPPNVVIVNMPDHGLKTGNRVRFIGAIDVAGISADELNAPSGYSVTVPLIEDLSDPEDPKWKEDPDHFTITVTTPANAAVTGGGTVTILANLQATGRGYTIFSDPPLDSNGDPLPSSGTQALTATTCWFNSMGVTGQHYFAGRWQQGARFVGCRFGYNLEDPVADEVINQGDIYFDTDNPDNPYSWVPASGYSKATGKAAFPPLFDFDHCTFSAPRPETIDGKVLVGFHGYLNSSGAVFAGLEIPGELRLPRHPLAIAYGGTGQTTAYEAKDALTIKGANMVAAATLNLATATGDYVEVTGTATITSFGTMPAGVRKTLRFQGTPTITHGGSISVPGNQSITVSASNVVEVLSLGAGNWMVVGFSSAGFNASFLVAGTVPDARLPTTMANKTLPEALMTPAATTIAALPAASSNVNQLRVVTNGASNKRLVISDGTFWRYMDGIQV